ncbi:MAG: recombinase family protein [Acidimicrobiia bacterium]|nr:recombinase family protein [Acidimicrobiia bacterium]
MQVVGYLRAVPGIEGGRIYAQGEAVREWARRSNAVVVATFQDDDGTVAGPGLRALLRSLSDEIDAVVVADAMTLAGDAIGQEVLRRILSEYEIGVVAADGALEGAADQPLRQVVRDVLDRTDELTRRLSAPAQTEGLVLEILPDAANG